MKVLFCSLQNKKMHIKQLQNNPTDEHYVTKKRTLQSLVLPIRVTVSIVVLKNWDPTPAGRLSLGGGKRPAPTMS